MDRIKKLQQTMPWEIDAALILSEHNRKYFTGFESSDGILLVTREKAFFLTDFRYIEAAKEQVTDCEVILLENHKKQLRELTAECGIKKAGIEAFHTTLAEFNRLKNELPAINFNQSNDLNDCINSMRMIKQPYEIERTIKAQEITDASFTHILEMIRPGVTERELSLEIEYFMKKNGASGPSFDLIVVSGENSSRPHGVPGGRKIQDGDFVTMDIGAVYKGYCSDMTRTVAIGNVSPEMHRVYDTVLKAQLEAEKAVRAGMVCSNVDRIAREIINGAGYKGCFGHGLGHSVGLEIHEEPRLSPNCSAILEENMFMTVEPGVYLQGRFGVRIEDLVLIAKNGCEILTKSPKELIIL